MSSRATSRQTVKGAVRESTRIKTARGIDLNSPPAADVHQPPAGQAAASRTRVSGRVNTPRRGNPRRAELSPPAVPGDGRAEAPIDVELEDDDVVFLNVTRNSSQGIWARNQSRRNEPVHVVEDDDPIVISGESGSTVFHSNHRKQARIPSNPTVIDSDEDDQSHKRGKKQPAPVPTFSCPICLNTLTEPSSTTCGHIFCLGCIRRSVQTLRSCPTCRKKLTMSNFHRVYLPNTS